MSCFLYKIKQQAHKSEIIFYLIISNIGPTSPEVADPELSRNFLSKATNVSNSESRFSFTSLSKAFNAFPAPPEDAAALSATSEYIYSRVCII